MNVVKRIMLDGPKYNAKVAINLPLLHTAGVFTSFETAVKF